MKPIIGETLILPADLTITLLGMRSIQFNLVSWKVIDVYTHDDTERVVLKRGKKVHDTYMDNIVSKIEFIATIK